MLDIVQKIGKAENAKFLNIRVAGWEEKPGPNQYDGKDLPW
jgi:hypothetical protein